MNIIRNIVNVQFDLPSSICIGNFDGIHIAHKKILDRSVDLAKNNKCISIAITFNPHPLKYFGYDIKLLVTERKKIELIEKRAIDNLIVLEFNENLAKMSPEFFVEKFLVKKFNIKFLTIGYNYKFGDRNTGDVTLLKILSKKYNFDVYEFEKITLKNTLVSSSNIRDLILSGNIELANELLGHHYCLEGYVNKGQHIGKLLGFPTANIDVQNELIPKFGVYATRVKINENYFPSVTNIGIKPTIQKDGNVYIEAHIINFEENIYDTFIELELISYIMEEKKFDNFNSLVEQMKKDKIKAINILQHNQLI
jgi:riboflavin kinase/FMN adenylyltransferase